MTVRRVSAEVTIEQFKEIRRILRGTYMPQGVTIWLYARNRNLGGRVPVVLLVEGEYGVVFEEARRVAGDDHE